MSTVEKIVKRKIADLSPAEYNPRHLNKKAYTDIRNSLTKFGFIDPIIVNMHPKRMNIIIGGHQRVRIWSDMGYDEVPTVELSLTELKERELNVRLNKNNAEFDWDALANNFETKDLLNWGFTEVDFDMAPPPNDPATEDEGPPKPPDKARAKVGSVYELGPHRLLCGDCIKDFDKLGCESIHAILTDPPYGQGQPGVPGDAPENLGSITQGLAKIAASFDNIIIIAFQSPRTFPALLDALRAEDIKFERLLWMYKQAQCTYPWRGWIMTSEAILVASTGDEPQWNEAKPYAHDCYMIPEISGEIEVEGWHGSVKPMNVVTDLVNRITPDDGILLDPFLGSGTTLIAAEHQGRTCYGIEIDPSYCDVIIERYCKLKGIESDPIFDCALS